MSRRWRKRPQLQLDGWLRLLDAVNFRLRPEASRAEGKGKGKLPPQPPACFVLYGPHGCGKRHMLEEAWKRMGGDPTQIDEPDLVVKEWKRVLADKTTHQNVLGGGGGRGRSIILIRHFTKKASMCPRFFSYFKTCILPRTLRPIVLTCIEKPYAGKHLLPTSIPTQLVRAPDEDRIVRIINGEILRLQRECPPYNGAGWTQRHIRALAVGCRGNVLFAFSQLLLPPLPDAPEATPGLDSESTNDFRTCELFLANRNLVGDPMESLAQRLDAAFAAELMPLHVQQNYLAHAHGPAGRHPRRSWGRTDSLRDADWPPRETAVADAALAAADMSAGDVVEAVIKRDQVHTLRPHANVLGCVAPMMLSHHFRRRQRSGAFAPPGIRHAFPAVLGKISSTNKRQRITRHFQHLHPNIMRGMPPEDMRQALRQVVVPRVIKRAVAEEETPATDDDDGLLSLFAGPRDLQSALELSSMAKVYKSGVTPTQKRRLTKRIKARGPGAAYRKLSATEAAKSRRRRQREDARKRVPPPKPKPKANPKPKLKRKKRAVPKRKKRRKAANKSNTLTSYFTVKKRKISDVKGSVAGQGETKRRRRRGGEGPV